LVGIPPKLAVSQVIRDIKICSSKWYNENFSSKIKFAWQDGFGSFTVSKSPAIPAKRKLQGLRPRTPTRIKQKLPYLQLVLGSIELPKN
jgi:Transposase IS200 like